MASFEVLNSTYLPTPLKRPVTRPIRPVSVDEEPRFLSLPLCLAPAELPTDRPVPSRAQIDFPWSLSRQFTALPVHPCGSSPRATALPGRTPPAGPANPTAFL